MIARSAAIAKRRPLPPTGRHGECGAALLIMLLGVVLAFTSLIASPLSKAAIDAQRQRKTLAALAQAKQALIAWSVMQGDIGTDSNHRPGTLPCPDSNYFGSANSGNASGSCSSGGATAIGRLPWKTLATGPLRDADGELLWYVVSDNFRRPGLNNAAINSDTPGTLLLYAGEGGTRLSPAGDELAALIFAPGPPLNGQNRLTFPNEVGSYLDRHGNWNNTSTVGPFIAGPWRDAQGNAVINDLIIGISARELIAAIEKRVLAEASQAQERHALANGGKYPNPAAANGLGCTAPIANINAAGTCASDATTCFGRLPEDSLAPYVAPWFLKNGWGRTIAYAVNKNDARQADGSNCTSSLNVDGALKRFVLIAPGTTRHGRPRPSLMLSDYVDDPANSDAWSGNPDFSAPTQNSNDQMRSRP
ncbi:hypothetical protein [Propionivibrio limicola]|uniref:hypothetical protein n=1 Tax=Propionivibrio limicola TaxID=167645 RepID=UPI0014796156|nr:hypothetical protein [Propionivibrio limicola]